ncbi:MAG: NAD-dependent epimerase/dehydratase family protein [Caulobacteraceae bacterium]
MEGVVARSTVLGAAAPRLLAGNDRLVVTGASGWLGMATLEMLAGLLGDAFPDRVACFGARPRRLVLRGGTEAVQHEMARLADLPPRPTLVLHLAFITQGPQMTLTAPDYVAANQALSRQVRDALLPIGAKAVFQASSGAAGLADPAGGPQSKQLYGWLKLQDEAAFAAWAEAEGRAALIGRLFNLSGPYINRRSTYALASFIGDALAGRPIEVRASAPVWRSYVAIAELMSVVLDWLTAGAEGVARFETAGGEALEAGDIARRVAAVLAPGHAVHRPRFDPEGAADRYVGDSAAYDALRRAAGVEAIAFDDQIRDTARYLAADSS